MRVRSVATICASLLLVGAIAGCPGRATVSSKGDPSAKSSTGGATAEDLLKSAVHQLRPENYSIAAAQDKPVSLLNSWRSLVVAEKQAEAEDKSPLPTLPSGWATDEEEKRLVSDKYDDLDAIYVRDCLLTHAAAKFLAARQTDELQRVQEVFQYVIRNIALRGEDDLEFPLTIYPLLLTGRGSAEDRAWVCAAILKQLRIDSVIVRPSAESKSGDEAWLLGVILNDRIHLFDPRLGVAIPSTTDAGALDSKPATLDEINAHPEWLQFLSARADQPYALDAESLKNPRVQPIVDSCSWSRRLSRLEQVLPTEDACVLFDPLVDDAGRSGMLTRTHAACSTLPLDSLKPWPHPEHQRETSRKISPQMIQQIQQAMSGFGAPVIVNADPEGKSPPVAVPERKMHKYRTDQMLGRFEEATKRYLQIRHLEVEMNEYPEIMQLHRLAAEDAIYWSGLCKFEAGEFDAVVEQMTGYLKRFERSGRWKFAARFLLAESQVRREHLTDAIAAIERTVADDPYREANAVRVKVWKLRLKPTESGSAK